MFNNKFYWSTIRKSIVAFGNMFNNIHIDRLDSDGNITQTLRVPLSYAPKQKFLARIAAQPQATNICRCDRGSIKVRRVCPCRPGIGISH